jgi:hypothetical protein
MAAQFRYLQRAADLLGDVGALWLHDGVSVERKWEFVEEVLGEILLDEHELRRVAPRNQYLGLIAVAEIRAGGRWSRRLHSNQRPPDPSCAGVVRASAGRTSPDSIPASAAMLWT